MARTKKQQLVDQEFKESLAVIPEPEGDDLIDNPVSSIVVLQTNPGPGDIIQVTAKPHLHTAWIGIVHSIDGDILDCYQPDGKNPRRFNVEAGAVHVVGKAMLKWAGPLPDRTKDHSRLDKV